MRAQENTAAISNLEKETVDGTERIKQLEAELAVCQEELKVYINQMEEVRAKHDKELRTKSDKVSTVICSCSLCLAMHGPLTLTNLLTSYSF